jgi:hypothetical protein
MPPIQTFGQTFYSGGVYAEWNKSFSLFGLGSAGWQGTLG